MRSVGESHNIAINAFADKLIGTCSSVTDVRCYMKVNLSKKLCHTPTRGKRPTAIPTWKYELVRDAILRIVPVEKPGMLAKDISENVRMLIPSSQLQDLGSVTWHTTTVRLNMEFEGELERIVNSKPIRLVLCAQVDT